jgi:hypothetical protein
MRMLFYIIKSKEMNEMNFFTRQTAQGTEYWDTKEKRIRFVPTGQDLGFEVTKEPKSMSKEGSKHVKGEGKITDLNSMNADQLLAYAEDNNIEVPGNMKKEDTIRKHIEESLTAAKE